MKNEELRRTFLFLLSGQELSFLSRPGQGRGGEERRGDTRDDQQQTGRTGRWVNMSDDIRRKKKKAGRKKESKPAEPARKESEVIKETRSSDPSPDPGDSQEKQSVVSKALFFCAILGEIHSAVKCRDQFLEMFYYRSGVELPQDGTQYWYTCFYIGTSISFRIVRICRCNVRAYLD